MSFRRKLLIAMTATVFLTVGAVTWIVSLRTRRAFEAADNARSAALVEQFRHEFARRGDDVVQRVERIAASEAVTRMAADLARGADAAAYVTDAKPTAEAQQLAFLEFLSADGAIISSAQWTARFGYKEVLPSPTPASAFLKLEELSDGSTLGLFAIRAVPSGNSSVYVLGGERIDQQFLQTLALPAGSRVILYRNAGAAFAPEAMITSQPLNGSATVENPDKLKPLIDYVLRHQTEASAIIHWTANKADSETFQAIPLRSDSGALLGVLLVGNSRRALIELVHHIRAVGLIVGGLGILIAILISGWVAARVTQPIEQLAGAAREVTAGNWNAAVPVNSQDEVGELAEAFNRMTRELLEQRERLVQAERVAAWRELARRLAHELKNPLFPLQITVENLLRARDTEMFDEVFRESTATLLAELANLKTIIGRFSDFSKMPQPQLQAVQVNEIARQVLALHEPQLRSPRPGAAGPERLITAHLELDEHLPRINADPELLHRVLSNLVLNAMDAMPDGGTLTLRTRQAEHSVVIEVADTGSGLTKEECGRLFTPYYTTKQHGTGLGLAIVQSVVSDHHGSIIVESAPGRGATFRIELPKARTLSADQGR